MSSGGARAARPEWLKVRAPAGPRAGKVAAVLERLALSTVCREACCPNVGACWNAGTATVLILGRECTRGCAFCNVERGSPAPPDPGEPARVAEAAAELGWRHVVVTSVTRDDLPDGGAGQFARVVEELRSAVPSAAVELLVPDFGGNAEALRTVVASRPDVLAHNVETVPRLYPAVRPQAEYRRSLDLFSRARAMDPELTLKSGLMAGLGETPGEIDDVLRDLFDVGCRSVTMGQYLPPTRNHLPVARYLSIEEFDRLGAEARRIGFSRVVSGPLVRSSYMAGA